MDGLKAYLFWLSASCLLVIGGLRVVAWYLNGGVK